MGQYKGNTKGKKWKQLTEKDRYKIEALFAQGLTPAQIGSALTPSRDRRTIEREIQRGLTTQRNSDWTERMVYLADVGQRKSEEAGSNKGRGLKIGHDHELAQFIVDKIKNERWSPGAVIGHIEAEGLEFKTSICIKTLYTYIDQGLFTEISNKELWVKKDGKKRSYRRVGVVALNNKNGKSITERPKGADDRTEQGHWEIDLVVGKQGTKPAILTLVERKTRKSIYVLVKNKTQKEVLAALRRIKSRVKGDFSAVFKSLTADNGSEFLDSNGMKMALQCGEVYYAHPYSSWERGSNENGNRILRRFIPKGTDIGKITAKQLQQIEDWVNNYPRKILGYQSANQIAS
jgi:IS30 family transposase